MSALVATDQRVQYEQDGFTIGREILPAGAVQRAVAGMENLRAGRYDLGRGPEESPWKPGDDPNKFCKIEMPHVADSGIREVVTHPNLGRFIAELTGADEVIVWWVQMLYKPPGGAAGTNVGWHQDRQYWRAWTEDSDLLTAWVALSDVTEQSGPVRFLRGSNHWGLLSSGDFFGQDLTEQQRGIPIPKGARWDEVAAVLKPGDVSVHDDLTYHGSGPNVSDRPRRSLAIHMRTNRSRVVDDIESVSIEDGHNLVKYVGDPDFNPVIYRRGET